MNRWITVLVLFSLVATSVALSVVQEHQDDARESVRATTAGTRDSTCTRTDGRCGPDFNGAKCSGMPSWAIYCHTANGWCGKTSAHRDAQSGSEYDKSSCGTWYCAIRRSGGNNILKKTYSLNEAQAVLGTGSHSRVQAIIPMTGSMVTAGNLASLGGDPHTLPKSWSGGSMYWGGWGQINAMRATCASAVSLPHLQVAHEALKKELAESKAELKEHSANAAAKAKAAAAEAEDAAVTKKAYEDQQALISNLAKALSDEKRGAKQDAEAEAKIVAREVEEDGKAKKEVSAAAAALKKWKEQQEAPAARLAEAQDKVKVDAQQTAAARAHQKSEAARFAARVAAANKRLADAQGALGGLHAAHMKEAGEAASAKSQAAAAEAIRKLKEKNVANHQKAVNESAKKIGEQ